jgi:xanthine dehydrogenase YagS FAD-binding subunit
MNRFEWVPATSVDQAISHLRSGAVAKAGGIDLLDMMKEGLTSPPRLVNIRTIPGLDRIAEEGGGVAIGPLATLTRIAASETVRRRLPALAAAAFAAATPNIRNAATAGGNLLQRPRCWYFRRSEFNCLKKGGDRCYAIEGENEYHAIFDNGVCAIVHPSSLAVPLVAYGASVAIEGGSGKRQVPLERFFVHPHDDLSRENVLAADELVVGITVPLPAKGTRSAYVKQGEKESFDWPLADAAVVLGMNGSQVRSASIVLGAAAAVPMRARKAEEFLGGKRLDEANARQAAALAVEGATPLEKNGYKVPMFRAVVARALLSA